MDMFFISRNTRKTENHLCLMTSEPDVLLARMRTGGSHLEENLSLAHLPASPRPFFLFNLILLMSNYGDSANNNNGATPFVPAPADPRQVAAFAALGVSPSAVLSADEIRSLDENGFLVLPAILSEEACRNIEDFVSSCEKNEGASVGLDHQIEPGVVRVGNMVGKDISGACKELVLNQKILSAVAHVFEGRGFQLDSLTSRRVLPGAGLQMLHRDVHDWRLRAVNCLVALTPFTTQNGATRVVPGTHRLPDPPRVALTGKGATLRAHPNELVLEVPRGTVVVNNPHTWHAGTRNDSRESRLGLHFAFFERQSFNLLNQAVTPKSVADKNYTLDEQAVLGLQVVSDAEYEARRAKKMRMPFKWPEIDQSGWSAAGEGKEQARL